MQKFSANYLQNIVITLKEIKVMSPAPLQQRMTSSICKLLSKNRGNNTFIILLISNEICAKKSSVNDKKYFLKETYFTKE